MVKEKLVTYGIEDVELHGDDDTERTRVSPQEEGHKVGQFSSSMKRKTTHGLDSYFENGPNVFVNKESTGGEEVWAEADRVSSGLIGGLDDKDLAGEEGGDADCGGEGTRLDFWLNSPAL
ncbi:myosin heavy chain-like protein [Perilla frutescens var. hirtella]|uniref:Myosin heavy chain-like protein n=1 Tax=Perilla frutescens var. hirtella TaxID=608512 RepID=A0AAD4IXD6_PERFH|nr:myosin heavy chain-like protein [Perilla frutescens var. hirtella]